MRFNMGFDRHFEHFDQHFGRGRHGHGRGHGHGHHGHGPGGFFGRFGGFMGGGGMRAARMLASGDLQIIVLALLNEKDRHGYEIIKALEEHSSGIYTPSPGVVYPALTYLEEMGYAASEAEGNKKRYSITEAGKEHLTKNRGLADETLEQLSRFGRKMARMQKHFADEEAEYDDDRSVRGEARKLRMEFQELRDELKSALREKFDSSLEEKQRVFEVLRKAIAEIRGGKKE